MAGTWKAWWSSSIHGGRIEARSVYLTVGQQAESKAGTKDWATTFKSMAPVTRSCV